MNILITGGCGFIGSNLLNKLLEISIIDKIFVIDNLSTGYIKNIENSLTNKRVIFVEGDIESYNLCLKYTKNIDVICHLAALGSVPRSLENPIISNSTNVSGFLNLIFAAHKNGVKKFIFASSSSTYGDSSTLPKVESNLGNLLSPYAVTKYVNELYADVFYRCYGLNYIGLRYFNVFGPNQDPNSPYAAVIPKFCLNILKGEKLIINGDGSTSRDFTFIDNVVRANVLAIFNEKKLAFNNIYNVACGESYSLNFLIDQLRNLSGIDFSIENREFRSGDILHSKASISKIHKNLNYTPNVEFVEGLSLTWNYYKNNYNLFYEI
jgi:UDP-N-acetylglucosamine 4-epimerase